jgi:secondary thiamine-phosphate synthase enzyme
MEYWYNSKKQGRLNMEWLKDAFTIRTVGKGMYEITEDVDKFIQGCEIEEGMCFLYNPHASASFIISEGYAGAAQKDVEEFYERIAPDGADWYRHTAEGPDDSPSHIRTTLTHQSLSIPIDDGKLSLGMWQEIFLFEHRTGRHTRRVQIRCLKVS